MRRRTWVCLTLAGVLCAAYVFFRVFVSPEYEFLRPSLRGRWIVHPEPQIAYRAPRTCPDALFVRRFAVGTLTDHQRIDVTAMRGFVLAVNGDTLPLSEARNWKKASRYDISPYLLPGRENEISVRVTNLEGPPALLVEGPASVRTGRNWSVSLGPSFESRSPAAAAMRDEAFRARQARSTISGYGVAVAALVLYNLAIVFALLPKRFKPWLGSGTPSPREERLLRLWPIFLFLVLVIVYGHNLATYPHQRGWLDWGGHLDYVRRLALGQGLPTVKDGWEMFQPPLYYASASLVYLAAGGPQHEVSATKALQAVSAVTTLLLILVALWLIRVLFPRATRLQSLGFTAVAVLPMNIYMAGMISSEPFSSFMIGLGAALAARFCFGVQKPARTAVIVGLGCGLAMLSKFGGLALLATLLLLAALRALEARPRWTWGLLTLAVALAVGGWFYARNVVLFQNPLAAQWDKVSGLHVEQSPGYRTLGTYLRFGEVFFHYPTFARSSDFWNGVYATAWGDGHGLFQDPMNKRLQAAGLAILWLSWLPMAAMVFGAWRALRQVFSREWDQPLFVLVSMAALLVFGLVWYSIQVPHYSSVKGFYVLALVPVAGVFAGMGLEAMCDRLGRLRWLVYAELGALTLAVLALFWYRGT
jgi:hypothetical protein